MNHDEPPKLRSPPTHRHRPFVPDGGDRGGVKQRDAGIGVCRDCGDHDDIGYFYLEGGELKNKKARVTNSRQYIGNWHEFITRAPSITIFENSVPTPPSEAPSGRCSAVPLCSEAIA